ncbi:MAG: IgGFc-binding protein [Deltaproteobacteria bacterium]|nr:IgGFc-binding protein [Deltaproteobacteria bacterium]
MRRLSLASISLAIAGTVLGCGPTVTGNNGDVDASTGGGGDGPPATCVAGQPGCYGSTHYVCAPDGHSRLDETACPQACDPQLGCVTCVPGSRSCDGTTSMICDEQGAGYQVGRDCAEWGSACATDGFCDDVCASAERTQSNVGCEYWPVALANTPELSPTDFDFRVVVANPSAQAAHVKVTQGGTMVAEVTVAVGGIEVIPLPWVAGQSFAIAQGSWSSLLVANGAYRLVSDTPVIATQFNPFEYSTGSVFSYTNDASLLLPAHTLTGRYVGASWVPLSRRTGTEDFFGNSYASIRYPGYLAIVGTNPTPTTVTLTASGEIQSDVSGRIARTARGGTLSFTVARGEVAHVTVASPPECVTGRPGFNDVRDCTTDPIFGMSCDIFDTCREQDYDLTGTQISATAPIEVFGGHTCAYAPYTAQACDHLEEQLPPVQTWGEDYVGAPMGEGGIGGLNIVRVVAAFPDTVVTVSPAQGGVSGGTLAAGQFLEFNATTPFQIHGSSAVMVAQYLVGQYASTPAAGRGDPALAMLPPAEQYRADYTFILPTSYNASTNGQNYLLVTRPPGLAITLDGNPVSAAFQAIGSWEIGVVLLDGGTHHIEAAQPFGVIAYGLGSFTSYATVAGLNLTPITVVN